MQSMFFCCMPQIQVYDVRFESTTMDGVCPSCGVLRFMNFQWMERILQDEIEFCCRLCPRTKGLWHSSTCEGLSSNTPKPCMTEVHHRMVEEEERMKIEDGRFFQKRKQAIHAKCSLHKKQIQGNGMTERAILRKLQTDGIGVDHGHQHI